METQTNHAAPPGPELDPGADDSMTRHDPSPPRSPGPGLRLRLWIGCLAGPLLAGAAIAFLLARTPDAAAGAGAEFRWVWLPGILGAAAGLSVVLALWLDRGIVRHLNGLVRALSDSQVAELRDLPSTTGWGELSELTLRAEATLARQRQLARAGAELVRLRDQLARVHEAFERWAKLGTWESMSAGSPGDAGFAALNPLLTTMNRELPRASVMSAAVRESSSAVQGAAAAALEEVRDVAEQSERGFVEATAMLTTVRELERLSVELEALRGAPIAAAETRARTAREGLDRYRAAAAEAIGRLVTASTESVVHLANGMQRMQEMTDQTGVISNRATLIALHALTGRATGAEGGALSDELKTLARDVRTASDRVRTLSAGIVDEAAKASERMTAVRAEVAGVLEAVPAEPPAAQLEAAADSTRLMERVREMIRDAMAKGERLSSAGERVSRAAERLKRRIEGEAAEIARLVSALNARAGAGAAAPQPAQTAPMLRMIESQAVDEEATDPARPDDAASTGKDRA